MPAAADPATRTVAAVRRFNRFYTRRIGVLDEGHLHSEFSLAEVRVLYELAHRESATAAEIVADLDLDPGYLSRMLSGFERRRLVARVASRRDGRQTDLRLTAKGRTVFRGLDTRAHKAIEALLEPVGEADRNRIVGAMSTVETLLRGARALGNQEFALRAPGPGDLGWVVQRHGVVYAQEYGWSPEFEGLVAGIVADYVAHFDSARERCWIAERDGKNLGSIFLVKHPERRGVAKLRLLLVEPSARGSGVGRRLVEECVRFARAAGYHTITLWTQSILTSARRIYEAAGFKLVDESRHRRFGPELVGQNWELELSRRNGLKA
jgi:DNA-binding MarR family transcriptional regulator/GNAT superfamily N-acetyltransferase